MLSRGVCYSAYQILEVMFPRNVYIVKEIVVMQEIDWRELEGQDIEVSFSVDFRSPKVRRLVKYLPHKAKPFVCESPPSNDAYHSFPYARVLTKKEPRVDWRNVPTGTKVSASNVSIEDAQNTPFVDTFLVYAPNVENKPNTAEYFVYNYRDPNIAHAFKFCVLREPCKPEWLKGGSNA